MPNYLTLAVAGGRKTQGLVDHCKGLPSDRRVLVVTFTQTNQQELSHRLRAQAGDLHNIEVLEHLYDEILIDEVQDLSGYDWEIIHDLLQSRIDVRMVGDVRQAVLSTNRPNRATTHRCRWYTHQMETVSP